MGKSCETLKFVSALSPNDLSTKSLMTSGTGHLLAEISLVLHHELSDPVDLLMPSFSLGTSPPAKALFL